MSQLERLLINYLQLAQASQRRRQLLVRDKLLLLAAVAAEQLGWTEIATNCRERILEHNPRHLVRRWSDLAQAVEAERFQTYYKQLRRKYSPEKAEHMLHSLGLKPTESAGGPHRLRDRATLLVAAISTETDRQARPAVDAPRPVGGLRAARSAKAKSDPPLAAPRWWPFWLGLGLWAALALAVLAGWTRV